MENKSLKPKIRFKGFTEAWEQRKLDELGVATSGTSIESEFVEGEKYKVISIGSYSENSTYNDQGIRAKLSDKTKNRILNKDDLTMILNDKTSSGRIIGRVLLIENSDLYVFNQRTQRIEPNTEKYDSSFLYEMLNAPLIRNKIFKSSQGNTQIYVNWSTIKELEYMIPNLEEQVKLGYMFKQLDNLITLHQRKCDKLVNIKKSLLEKMFPKNGNNVPEIRFKGFTEAWEQRKLEEIAEISAGGDIDNSKICENGKYPVIANALTNKGIVGYYEKEYRVKAPAITVTGRGDIGHALARNIDFTPVVRLLALKTKHNNNFIANAINTKKIIVESTGVPQLTVPQLGSYEIYFTTEKEEAKIGNFFENIDNLITLHQKKLNKLKNIKKSLLEKMFV